MTCWHRSSSTAFFFILFFPVVTQEFSVVIYTQEKTIIKDALREISRKKQKKKAENQNTVSKQPSKRKHLKKRLLETYSETQEEEPHLRHSGYKPKMRDIITCFSYIQGEELDFEYTSKPFSYHPSSGEESPGLRKLYLIFCVQLFYMSHFTQYELSPLKTKSR